MQTRTLTIGGILMLLVLPWGATAQPAPQQADSHAILLQAWGEGTDIALSWQWLDVGPSVRAAKTFHVYELVGTTLDWVISVDQDDLDASELRIPVESSSQYHTYVMTVEYWDREGLTSHPATASGDYPYCASISLAPRPGVNLECLYPPPPPGPPG